ncbi:MAG: hypothetical protein ACRBCI_07445 [Cellvibrionaceae bacterium]
MNTGDIQQQSNIIPSNYRKKSKNKDWIFFLVIIGFCGFILNDNREELLAHFHAGEYFEMKELIILLFPVLFFGKKIKRSWGRNKYGETPLVMNPFPAAIGEKFAGYVEINKGVDGLQFSAELRLIENAEVYMDDYTEFQSNIVTRFPVSVISERAVIGTRLLLETPMPDNQPESQPSHRNRYYTWRLAIYSSDKAFRRTWAIPVVAPS